MIHHYFCLSGASVPRRRRADKSRGDFLVEGQPTEARR